MLESLTSGLGSEARCVVITGPAGIGKTRLTAEAAEVARRRGMVVAAAVASQSAASIPYGALAPLLPTDHVLSDTPGGLNRRAARAIRDLGEGAPVLLVIDDAHTLDDASATLLHELVHEGAIHVLVTVRDGEPAPAPVLDLLGDALVADRLPLGPLDAAQVATLVDTVLDGPVDGAVAHRVWSRTGGNPMYARELVLGGLESGSLRRDDGLWRWAAASAPPAGLVELVGQRIAALDEGDRRAMVVLTIARDMGLADAEELLGAEVVARLIERGFATVGGDGRRRPVRPAHPVYEDALRAMTTWARTREVSRSVADRITARGARRRGDHLRAVTLLLDAGAHVDLELLEAAARESYVAYDLALTERVARAALDAGAGPGLTRVLGEILRWQGRHEEAQELLAGVDLGTVTDDGDIALIAIIRAECLFRGLARRADAESVLRAAEQAIGDPGWRAELRAARGEIAALAGDIQEALRLALPVLADDATPRASVVGAGAAAPALLAGGRADDAAAIAERAFSVALGLGPQPAIAHPALQAIVQSMALVESGRLQEADTVARTGYEWSLASGFPIGQAWFALALGWCRLVSGGLLDAERLFREAAIGFRDVREVGLRRWALAGAVQASAWRGDRDAARTALSAIVPTSETAILLAEVDVARARAWVAVLDGERSHAVDQLCAAAEAARSAGQHGFALAALHDIVRLGDPRAVPGDIAAFESVQGRLATARRDHARALIDQDGPALGAAGDAFAALGADLLAAEAYSHAATRAARDGARGGARHAARAEQLAATCGAPHLPATGRLDAGPLTRRELEIAGLAIRGRSNGEIGALLGISTRTVGNHLQRAYTKLGVSDRSGLADAMRSTPMG